MNQIVLNVNVNRLEITQDVITTGGSVNYDSCKFNFDSEWTGFTKTAVFSADGRDSYRVALDDGGCCKIPAPCIERECILRIGVFGVSDDDVVLTTNSVAHRVDEGIEAAGEWIEEDYSLVVNAIKLLKDEAQAYMQELEKRFDALVEKVTEGGTAGVTSFSDFPDDWYFPKPFEDAANCPAATKGASYDDFLEYRLNPLVSEFPEYVTRSQIGTDHSGVYPVYAYVFEPEHYEKTVLISACIHGSERITFHSVCNFMDEVCRHNTTDRTLSYIRSRVKIVLVPVVSPYGLMHGSAKNAAGVDINLNFPYKWSECTKANKGEQAGDMQETANIMTLLNSLKSDKLCAVLDLHTSSHVLTGRAAFYPRGQKGCAVALAQTVRRFRYAAGTSGLNDAAVVPASNPTLINYAADSLEVNACELLWTNSLYGGIFSNECITRFTEYIGNVLITLAKNSDVTLREKPEPFVKHFSWKSSSASDVFTVTATGEAEKMGVSACNIRLISPANVTADGYVTLNVSQSCTVKINPLLYQKNSPEQQLADRQNMSAFSHELTLSAGTHVIPIASVLQGYFTSFNADAEYMFCENVSFAVAFSASVASAVKVIGFAVTISAVPSSLASAVEISHPIGLAADYSAEDVPVQQVDYPLMTYTEIDGSIEH